MAPFYRDPLGVIVEDVTAHQAAEEVAVFFETNGVPGLMFWHIAAEQYTGGRIRSEAVHVATRPDPAFRGTAYFVSESQLAPPAGFSELPYKESYGGRRPRVYVNR